MLIEMLKGKIHRATVTQAELNYTGSITIDKRLMDASHIVEYEKVQIADVNNGQRFETYVIAGPEDSGVICLNGAAARCVSVGDEIIIMSYCQVDSTEVENTHPYVVLVDENNKITTETRYEKYGMFKEDY